MHLKSWVEGRGTHSHTEIANKKGTQNIVFLPRRHIGIVPWVQAFEQRMFAKEESSTDLERHIHYSSIRKDKKKKFSRLQKNSHECNENRCAEFSLRKSSIITSLS